MPKFQYGDRVKLIKPDSGIMYDADFKAGIFAYVTNHYSFVVRFEREDIEELSYVYHEDWFEKVEEAKDNVNSPAHYSQNHKGIECIDAMEAMLTPEEFLGYIRGNIFKYGWRFRYKNGAEDVAKHKWYMDKLNKHLEQYPHLTKGIK